MFSFEGQYKKPRTINYSKEKDVGKSDLIENAKYEREKRALTNRKIICATIIQRAYRHYRIRKIKRQKAFSEYHNLIIELKSKNITIVDNDFLNLISKITDKLFIFFDGKNSDDQSLKPLIECLIKPEIVNQIVANQPINNYYNAVTFSLLLRVTSRYMGSIIENSQPTKYNLFLRFIEQFFASLTKYDCSVVHLKSFHKKLLTLLSDSNYFTHMSLFVCRQLIKNNEAMDSCYKNPKVNYILQLILQPVKQSQQLNVLPSVLISFIRNIYSAPYQNHSLDQYKLMSMALLDNVGMEVVVDIVFNNFDKTHSAHNKIYPSIGLVYFCLFIQLSSASELSTQQMNASAQILILFYHMSTVLMATNELYLSNNLSKAPNSSAWIGARDDFDFEMKDTEEPYTSSDDSSSDADVDMKASELAPVEDREMTVLEQEIALCLKCKFAHVILPSAILAKDPSIDQATLIDAIGYVYHLLVLQTKLIGNLESKTFILNLIQTAKTISRRLWTCTVEQRSKDVNKSVMDALIKWEIRFNDSELDLFFGKLLCFANCLHWRLLSVQDLDLINPSSDRSSEVLEFSSDELCGIVLKLRDIMCGLIFLIYPSSSQQTRTKMTPMFTEKLTKIFIELQRVVIRLYNRDVRKGLKVSGKRLEWVMSDVCRINVNNLKNFKYLLLEDYRFGKISSNQLTSQDLRQFVILKEMPFIVPIGTRMQIFKQIIVSMEVSPHLNTRLLVRIRRDHVYEDAFNQITKKAIPNLRSHLKIEFIDRFGIDEDGVDGGGLLREFLTSIILEACDPKRGLFVSTTNNLLYPNPEIETLYPDNWQSHLYFIGRMIGLIVFKGLLVEVPFAPFFLQKLFNNRSSKEEIDIDNLQYLDEDLYRNLLSLKSMTTVEDISLDFTLSRSCYGVSRTVDLKPDGGNILVTNQNKIEYIYLVADYKLHRQISAQTAVIISGVNDILPIECFQLFDLDELSFIITGGGAPIDMDDLRRNTVYHGLDDPVTSRTIVNFWQVVNEMTEEEKRSFVQFVTSLSRAPMLGFGELSPKFAIIVVPDTDRLPTASTCLNLLKLPAYEDLEQMRHRLLYAIGSDTGFHLS